MITHYFYDGQIRRYLLQFCAIFAGLQVKTGTGECGDEDFITVPISIANKDRVVAAIQAGNTSNRPFSVPAMAVHMSGLNLGTLRKGVNVVDKRVVLPSGGLYPNDLKVVTRVMPMAFDMDIELSIYASNTLQMHQILEQILVLFDPTLQIQTGDTALDWTKITTVELTGVTNDENFPIGQDRRIIPWTLQFKMPVYLSVPMDVRDEVVRTAIIKMGDLDKYQVNEFDENGDPIPFETGGDWGTVTVTGD